MKKFLLCLLAFSSLESCLDEDGFTELELKKIAQSGFPVPNPKPIIILPTMSVKFEIVISGDSILYSNPIFTLDDMEVSCQVCGRPPFQIEVTNGKLKCFCFKHIAKRTKVDVEI